MAALQFQTFYYIIYNDILLAVFILQEQCKNGYNNANAASYHDCIGYRDNNVKQYLLILSQSICYDVLNSLCHGAQLLRFGSHTKS